MQSWKLENWGPSAGYGEGPVVARDGSLLTVAIDRGEVLRWRDGAAEVVAVLAGGPNGLAEGTDGRLYVAQNGAQSPVSPPKVLRAECRASRTVSSRGSLENLTHRTTSRSGRMDCSM